MLTNVLKKHADSILGSKNGVRFYTEVTVSPIHIGCRHYGQSEPRGRRKRIQSNPQYDDDGDDDDDEKRKYWKSLFFKFSSTFHFSKLLVWKFANSLGT